MPIYRRDMQPNWQPLDIGNDLVYLQPLQQTDFDALYAVASDPLIWEQHPNPNRYQRAVFQKYFEGAMESKGAFLIKRIADDAVMGCSRYYDYDAEKKAVKIGYTFLGRAYWGSVYNPAVKKLMIDYAFQWVSKVLFEIGANNIRSQKAIERLGAEKTDESLVTYFGETPQLNFIYTISKI